MQISLPSRLNPPPAPTVYSTMVNSTNALAIEAAEVPATSIPSQSSSVQEPFRFLELPPELRLLVYEYSVVVGKVFYTPDPYSMSTETRFKDWELYRVPELAIFRVCKQIHDEAEKCITPRTCSCFRTSSSFDSHSILNHLSGVFCGRNWRTTFPSPIDGCSRRKLSTLSRTSASLTISDSQRH